MHPPRTDQQCSEEKDECQGEHLVMKGPQRKKPDNNGAHHGTCIDTVNHLERGLIMTGPMNKTGQYCHLEHL